MRGRGIGKIEEGRKITCCQGFDIAHSVVFTAVEVILKLLECVVDGNGEVVLSTTPAEDRYISSYISAKNRRTTSSAGEQNQFLAASGKSRSPEKLLPERLRGEEDYTHARPVVCVPLTRQHRTARLQWCREHLVD
ncbi:hypothetical protein TNCV_3902851 [Trichonephila clavipes]|nr:hypothetical protein TNCV_3902851 [Trichonephila clavipes]